MEENNKYLLSTRPLTKAVVDEAAAKGVIIESLSFITTHPVEEEEVIQKIKAVAAVPHTVIFTSMNAVEAVASHVADVPWKIYAIGNTTRQLIEEKWGVSRLAATADNALQLGERLIDDGVRKAVFFCGNIRRDELPNKIRSEGGNVEEVVVYETTETATRLSRQYDGILFFSPSAVHSFYSQNNPAPTTVFFAIGKTTAEALQQYKAKNIRIAGKTDKVKMTREAIAWLTKAH